MLLSFYFKHEYKNKNNYIKVFSVHFFVKTEIVHFFRLNMKHACEVLHFEHQK